MQDTSQIQDISKINEKLRDERDDLQMKLEQLSRTYETCVAEISRERAQM